MRVRARGRRRRRTFVARGARIIFGEGGGGASPEVGRDSWREERGETFVARGRPCQRSCCPRSGAARGATRRANTYKRTPVCEGLQASGGIASTDEGPLTVFSHAGGALGTSKPATHSLRPEKCFENEHSTQNTTRHRHKSDVFRTNPPPLPRGKSWTQASAPSAGAHNAPLTPPLRSLRQA